LVAEVFADQQLEALPKFPEIGREELFRFFTLTRRTWRSSIPAGVEALRTAWACCHRVLVAVAGVRARRRRGRAPGRAVVRLAGQLRIDPDVIRHS
jgi:hypothetical protein